MALRDIIGQEKAINILLGTIGKGRIPSAYLFAGEQGIGKKLTAINISKLLNCQNPQPLTTRPGELPPRSGGFAEENEETNPRSDACDSCPSCKKIDSRTHPDFLLVEPEKGEIRVDEIRAIEEALSFAPYEGKIKVVVVDDAESMNQSAANAFLKTLEEPPAQSLIILVSSSPDRLPETIRSRCSRVNFSPLSPEKCEEVIKKQGSGVRGQGLEKNNYLSTVSRLSMGRPGLAIANDLIEERDWFLRLFRELTNRSNKETWEDREEIESWFNSAMIFLRDMAVFRITGKPDMLINIDLKDRIAAVSKTVELKDIIDSYAKISFLKRYLEFNLNKSITWNYTGFILEKFGRGI
ncbi:MAG: DNA polymerase III subunit delta' [Nitrospirae bacterium]|nr:MAG: DNA polymerase III subunit delta' [Nitrospirota bacterium]